VSLLNTQDSEKTTNGKAIGSLIIGMISIFGLIFIEEGTLLSIAGLILGIMSLKETKPFKEIGSKLAMGGILLNFIGFIGFVRLFI
jgi:hypothetical protein